MKCLGRFGLPAIASFKINFLPMPDEEQIKQKLQQSLLRKNKQLKLGFVIARVNMSQFAQNSNEFFKLDGKVALVTGGGR